MEIIKILKDEANGLTIKDMTRILEVEYKPLYRCFLKLEEDRKVKVEKVGKYHTKVYSLENDGKRNEKLENEIHSETCECDQCRPNREIPDYL